MPSGTLESEVDVQYVPVRYSLMYYRGFFMVKDGLTVQAGDLCIVRSPRGKELGKVLAAPCSYEGEVVWLKNAKTHGERDRQGGGNLLLSGEVLRIATEDDVEKVRERFARGTRREEVFCNDRIRAHDLPMKLAGVEYLFDGEKIIFYFLAEGRVDFRALVRDLAKEYRTRIEMKQIGVRDEARLLAEYEHCGRRLCCKGFLNNLEPVTMKMAKTQKTTLDPAKISGRCGRLMCCLRYEDPVYRELNEALPKKGTTVRTGEGNARVLSRDVLQQKLLVQTDAGKQVTIQAKDVLEVVRPEKEPRRKHRDPKTAEKATEARGARERRRPARSRRRKRK